LVPAVVWVLLLLVLRFVPEAQALSGMRCAAAPIAFIVLAALGTWLCWRTGPDRPNRLAALQLAEVACYAASFLSAATLAEAPASWVLSGFFALSCLHWGSHYALTPLGLLPVALTPLVFFGAGGLDLVSLTIAAVGIVLYFSSARLTAHQRRHASHASRSEEVISRIQSLLRQRDPLVLRRRETTQTAFIHRLKNALAAHAGIIDLVRNAVLDEEARERLRLTADYLNELSNDAERLLGREGSGADNRPVTHLFDLGNAISGRAPGPGARARLEVRKLPNAVVQGDPAVLVIMLGTLVDNALESGARTVIVDGALDSARTWIEISVTDDGPGLPDRVRERLFQPYNTTGKSRGVGLGIFLAAQIAESFGGSIHVSAPGPAGTRFAVRLPVESLAP
jgi:signal transduction histidine kinase